MKIIITIFLIILNFSLHSKTSFLKPIPLKKNEEIIDITPYNYPKKTDEDSDEYNIVLFSSTDIHGNYFPKNNSMPKKKDEFYLTGGLQYMASFFDVLRNEFGERSMYLDAGDQFQGGVESKISSGDIITQFYNIMNLDSSTIGNHEFDYGIDYLQNRSKAANFEYVIGNILNGTGKSEFLEKNQVTNKTYQLGKIKVGVIGLITKVTKSTSGWEGIKDYEFLEYRNSIKKYSKALREKNVDLVILLSHFGAKCSNYSEIYEKYTLNIYNTSYEGLHCNPTEEMEILLNSLEPNLIDVVVSGHTHDNVHQFINGYPVISSVNNGKYFNAMYLYFDKNSEGKYVFNPNKTIIEGPIPVCAKVFKENKRCEFLENETLSSYEINKFKFHNVTIEKNKKLEELSDKWWEQYQKYVTQVLCYLKGKFEKSINKEYALGNFFTDFLRDVTGADVGIYNSGGFRTVWNEGNISVANVMEMSPFENNIVSFSMTGDELLIMLKQTEESTSFDFYPISGLKIQILESGHSKKLISAKIFDGVYEHEIEKNKTYKIATNSFLLKGGDDFAKVIKWYKVKDFVDYNETQQNLIEYLRNINKINSDNYIDELNPRILVITQNFLRRLINKILNLFL
jgi:2',3'-cyclic-nucleotide 2'-phosphodiesterase (5'-nucleotidase family)